MFLDCIALARLDVTNFLNIRYCSMKSNTHFFLLLNLQERSAILSQLVSVTVKAFRLEWLYISQFKHLIVQHCRACCLWFTIYVLTELTVLRRWYLQKMYMGSSCLCIHPHILCPNLLNRFQYRNSTLREVQTESCPFSKKKNLCIT
jgi:hypothetical protein